MDNRPIGIFDSGLGGLTCVREVMNIMPGEDITISETRAECPTAREALPQL